MGIFGFACGRCWEYDCDCTPEQLAEYEKKSEENRDIKRYTEYTKTNPKVGMGDIVYKNGKEWYVREVVDGIGIITSLDNDETNGAPFKLEEPYKKHFPLMGGELDSGDKDLKISFNNIVLDFSETPMTVDEIIESGDFDYLTISDIRKMRELKGEL